MSVYVVNGASGVQQPHGVAFGQPVNVNYFINKKSEADSYMGKTLLAVGALTFGMIFHKNMGNLIKKYTPGIFNFFAKHLGKPLSKFAHAHRKNFFVKYAAQGKREFADIGDTIVKWATAKKV